MAKPYRLKPIRGVRLLRTVLIVNALFALVKVGFAGMAISIAADLRLDPAADAAWRDMLREMGQFDDKQVAVVLIATVYLAFWLFGMVRNAHAAGATRMPYTPWRAVLWYLLPFVSWVLAGRVMHALWVVTDPSRPAARYAPDSIAPLPRLVLWWWVFFVAEDAHQFGQAAWFAASDWAAYAHAPITITNMVLEGLLGAGIWFLTFLLVGALQRRWKEQQARFPAATADAHPAGAVHAPTEARAET